MTRPAPLIIHFFVSASLALTAAHAMASEDTLFLPIRAVVNSNEANTKLGQDVKFYFAGQPTPAVLEDKGQDTTSRKTRSEMQTPANACNRAMLSALIALKARAVSLGANAVVNIKSNYKHIEFASATQFECHPAAFSTGVALKAGFAKIAE